VTVEIKPKHAPFAIGVHCHAHKINVAMKTLSQLEIFHAVEELMRICHAYFFHSPKKYSEFKSFAQTIDTKGLKLLKNVTTCWLSLLEPMRWILSEFCTLVDKISLNYFRCIHFQALISLFRLLDLSGFLSAFV
jgi:hypothetical protein